MEAKEKLTKARASLILSQPFFACLALKMPLIEDKTCETAWTDGARMGYNPDFINSLSLDEVKGVICHEILHVTNLHHLRMQAREARAWNIASDKAINPLIKSANLALPSGALYGSGLSAEDEYTKTPKGGGGQGKGGQGADVGKCGEVRPYKGPDGKGASEADIKAHENQIKVDVSQARQIAKRAGKMPADLDRIISDMIESKVSWREVLQRFCLDSIKSDYTWKRPNRRFIPRVYMPSLDGQKLSRIIITIDTSGSIDDSDLRTFAGEIQEILDTFNIDEIQVLYVDSALQSSETFHKYDRVILHAKGGGGTSFRPAFEHIEAQGLDLVALIYFTDGYSSSFPEIPDFPVLWALTVKRAFQPPFGEAVYINMNE